MHEEKKIDTRPEPTPGHIILAGMDLTKYDATPPGEMLREKPPTDEEVAADEVLRYCRAWNDTHDRKVGRIENELKGYVAVDYLDNREIHTSAANWVELLTKLVGTAPAV